MILETLITFAFFSISGKINDKERWYYWGAEGRRDESPLFVWRMTDCPGTLLCDEKQYQQQIHTTLRNISRDSSHSAGDKK